MSDPFLEITSGSRAGQRIHVPSKGLLIGRDADVDVPLPEDASVSRRHARFITIASGGVLVEDLGSRNGTYVNDERVTQAVLLKERDVIRVGATDLAFFGSDDSTRVDDSGWPTDARSGGVAIGGSVHAQRGAIGAIGKVAGNVDMSRQTVTAGAEGYAAGRDIYHDERHEYDASGLAVITRSRGAARFLLVIGTLIAFAGFGLFGYPILKGIISTASQISESQEAGSRCDELTFASPAWRECQRKASQSGGGDFPSLTPWLPLGAALFFGGMVISVIGVFMIRRED